MEFRVLSARIALLDLACVVSLSDWVTKKDDRTVKSSWSHKIGSVTTLCEREHERMEINHPPHDTVQALAVVLPDDTCPADLSGGPFGFVRTQNGTASSVTAVLEDSPTFPRVWCGHP